MKKRVAILLAAVLAMTGPGQAVVSAAEFTDVEIMEDSVSSGEEVFTSGEETVEFESGEAEIVMTADVSALAEASKAKYYGGYVTKEQFEHWEETDEEPEDFYTTYVEAASPDEFFSALEGENTGYCLLTLRDVEGGYTDLNVPAGLKLGLAWGDSPKLKSISSEKGVYIHTHVETPGKLEMKGTGSLTLSSRMINGVIVGTGKKDSLIINKVDWMPPRVGGIQGVENVTFETNVMHLSGGPTEFYNIINTEKRDVDFWIQGKPGKNMPVFHKTYDFGMNEWGTENAVCVAYVDDLDSEDMVAMNPGAGKQVVKFDLKNDLERFRMMKKTKTIVPEGSPDYNIDLDGKTFIIDRAGVNRNYYIYRFRSNQAMTAKEAFDLEGYGNVPLENNELIDAVPTLSQAHRIAAAYQNGRLGEEYYFVYLPDRADFGSVLKFPENVKGIKYHGRLNWDEERQVMDTLPVKISEIEVPAGKTIGFISMKSDTGNLTVKGDGKVDFKSCRLNKNITAKNVSLSGTSVKSVDTDILRVTSDVYVTGKLKFKRGGIGGNILAKAAASLEFGAIDNPKYLGEAKQFQILQENTKSKKAAIYFDTYNVNLGVDKVPGSNGTQPITIVPYNYEKAAAENAPFVKDCFDYNYKLNGAGGQQSPWLYKCEFGDNDAVRLMKVNKTAAKKFPWRLVCFSYAQGKYIQARAGFGTAFPSKEWTDSKGRYLTAYDLYKGNYIRTKAYIEAADGALPLPAKGKNYAVGDLKYKVTKSAASGGTVMLYGPVSKNCTSVVVPSTVKINDYTFKVTSIYNRTFKECTKLKKVTIGSYVVSIGKEAFYGCKVLKSITINSKYITAVGSSALKGIYSKAVIKVPSSKYTTYKKLLSGKGQSKYVKVTK